MLDELQRRNYNADTIRGYIHAVKESARYFGKSPEAMGADEVREFQLYMIRIRCQIKGDWQWFAHKLLLGQGRKLCNCSGCCKSGHILVVA